jgi:2-polyprenyl-3-methyl-5-hydroxy-6-metoxy-1,4-benzoquinol methylase
MKFLNSVNPEIFDPYKFRSKNFYSKVNQDNIKIFKKFKYLLTKKNFKCKLCNSSKIIKNFLQVNKSYYLRKCKNCELVFPNIDVLKINNYEEIVYKDYHDTEISKNDIKNIKYRNLKLLKNRYEYCYKSIFKNKKKKILEVGCGNGDFLKYLKSKKILTTGIEYNLNLVERCKKKGLNIFYKNLSVSSGNYFDACYMFDVVEHLTNPIKSFQNINNSLKKNGYFIFYTPNINSLGFELLKEKQNLIYPFHHISFFSKKNIKIISKKTNFKVVSIETKGLDIIDYLFFLEFKKKLKMSQLGNEFINLAQSLIDKSGFANHSRVILRKIK